MRASARAIMTSAAGLGLVMMDNTAVTLALPAIAASLGAVVADLQWVLSAPLLAAAVVLPLAGAIGDRYGALRAMRIGLLVFAVAALVVATSPDVVTLIVARAAQGVGQAFMLPNGAALLAANVPVARRTRAVSTWISVSSLGLVLGPLGGGLAIEHLGWRWLFAGHLLVAVAGIIGTRRLSDSEHRSPHPIDLRGVVAGGAALFCTCFGLIELGRPSGRTGLALLGLGLGVAAAGAFVAIQRRRPHPLLDFGMLRNRQFAAVVLAALVYNGALSGTTFLLSLLMQNARGVAPGAVGLILLCATAGIPLGSQLAGSLGTRLGLRVVMAAAALVLGIGYTIVAGLALAPPALLAVPLLITGLASGALFASDTVAALAVATPQKVSSGLASVSLSRQVGSLLGIAGLGALSAAVTPVSQPAGARVAMVMAGLVVLPCALLLWRYVRHQAP
ncbi:MFS transporter [Dactylosporangium sucinum]|uniref:MFS transporter n=1 Tax=Dactylosporangium sucinum TaxID=1424081 RepID=A0A917TZA7_9ACTN|nr:MFS transporter [Dactylosporangium sucinum]GGM45829.1 MFS transporter [Dactylosporangium sucinum]